MTPKVAVVADSTAYLPRELVERYDIRRVPLQVVVGGVAYDDGGGISPQQVAEALRGWVPVSTSRPSVGRFLEAYRQAFSEGFSEVVSVHLSAEMSGTLQAAELAAADAPLPVHVVDSRSLGMGLGFAAIAAADAIAQGADGAAAARVAEKRASMTSAVFYVDTLEHLRRGGRIGAAQAFLGSALMVKPLLTLSEGRISPLEKVRTSSRAISRLEEIVVERAGTNPVDLAVHHLANGEKAEALAARLRKRLEPVLRDLYVAEVGAVVGAHVGPGMLAVVVAPR